MSAEIRHTTGEDGRLTRVRLFLGEEDVSGLSLRDLEMRVGDVPVRLGGVGGVGTKRGHRRKGYSRRVMEGSTAFMKEAGFDVAILFGIRDFYPKFGYAVCMAEVSATLSTRHAERASARFGFSLADESDYELVRGLYERTNASRTGSVVRKKGVWKGFDKGSRFGVEARCFVAKDSSGELEAYVLLDVNEEETDCGEVAARSPEGYEAAVRFLAEDAIAKRTGEIHAFCPCDHLFVDVATRFGVQLKMRRPRCGNAMGRVVDQRSLLEKLLPLFSARLNSSKLSGKKLALSISTELGSSTIGYDGERASLEASASKDSCELPTPALMQLVTGYRDPFAVGAKLKGKLAADAVRALWPRGEAYMWWPDRF